MEKDRMPKKIFNQEMEGARIRGRPRKRWKEEVEGDLQVLGVRRWKELVADRKKWKGLVRQAKVHSGLKCQWKKKKKGRRSTLRTGFSYAPHPNTTTTTTTTTIALRLYMEITLGR